MNTLTIDDYTWVKMLYVGYVWGDNDDVSVLLLLLFPDFFREIV